MKISVINGPNLNMLGTREPSLYGNLTISDISKQIEIKADELGVEIELFQSNIEGEIVEKIHSLYDNFDGFIINAAAYTHTSIAIRDAALSVSLPFIEVHLSNVYKREPFRHKSYLADIALGVISGFGYLSYTLALEALVKHIKAQAQA